MKKFLKGFGLIGLVLVLVGVALAFYVLLIEPNRLVVNENTLEIADWNKSFEGFKIVAISDIHGGSSFIDEAKIRDVVSLANAQKPDLIVLLGDFVSQRHESKPIKGRSLKMPMATIAENLKGFNAKHGVVAVLGNHDGWYDDDIVARELESVGIKVLQNELLSIEKAGSYLNILGLVDHRRIFDDNAFRTELKSKIGETKNDGDIVILEHSPDIVPVVTGKNSISPNTKLFLAGHTHGGQVWFPIWGSLIVPSDYSGKYAFGHILDGDTDVFVTTGIGTSVVPIRFMVPPEIAVLTLVYEYRDSPIGSHQLK